MRYAAPRWATKRDPSRPTDGGLVAAASLLYAGGPLMGWQREVADVALERDPETGRYVYDSITLIVGRRAGKTRLTHGVPLTRGLLGPVALTRPNGSLARVPFLAASTAQNATQAIKRLSETYDAFREGAPDGIAKSCRFLSGVNHAAIELNYRTRRHGRWARNGSMSKLSVFPPTPHAVRGDKYLFLSIDEALTLTLNDGREILEAARPTLSEFAGEAQLWVVSNEGKQSSGFLAERKRLGRQAVEEGRQSGTAYFEWSMAEDGDPTDPAVWRAAHPAVGETLTESALARDLEELGVDAFAREYLNYSAPAAHALPPLAALWPTLPTDSLASGLPPRRSYAFEVSHDRSTAGIVAAWASGDSVALSVVDYRPGEGTHWLRESLRELAQHERTQLIAYDAAGAASAVGRILEHEYPQRIRAAKAGSPRASAGGLIDLATSHNLRHDGDPELAASAAGARVRDYGETVYWDRRHSDSDPSLVIAASLAADAAQRARSEPVIV